MKYDIGDVVKIIDIKNHNFVFSEGVKVGHYALILEKQYNGYISDVNGNIGHNCDGFFPTRRGQMLPDEQRRFGIIKKQDTLFLCIYNGNIYFLNNETKKLIVFNNILREYRKSALDNLIMTIEKSYKERGDKNV